VNILLPFDGSASSYKALDYAKKFVEGMAEYELIIVTVEKTFMPTPPERPYIEIKPEDFVAERIRHHEYGTIISPCFRTRSNILTASAIPESGHT